MRGVEAEKIGLIRVKKVHWVIAIAIHVLTMGGTAYTSYIKAQSDVQKQFVDQQLDNEKTFVHKDEMKEEMRAVNAKLDRLLENVGEINGYLHHRR